jgi:hypothetical protein
VFALKAAIELFLIRGGGDSHFYHFSHFFKALRALDVILPYVFNVLEGFREHIRNRMTVAF